MPKCDICNRLVQGTAVSSEQLRRAVFQKGFNPFALGLCEELIKKYHAMGVGKEAAYESFKGALAQDNSDWDVCPKCLNKLRPYLGERPQAAGVASSEVSFDPIRQAVAASAASARYKPSGGHPECQVSQDVSRKTNSAPLQPAPLLTRIVASLLPCKRKWLLWAARKGHSGLIRGLLRSGVSPDVRNKVGETPLMVASANGQAEAVTALLAGGANPNIQNAGK